MTTVWKTAQEEELHCWSINREKLRRSDYLEIKKLYWQRLLSKIGILHVLGTDARILEVGCGPAGVFLLLPRESRNDQYYVLDPLLARYKEMFPDYFGRCVEVDSALETWQFQPDLRFDLILAINCIDHSLDIQKFLAQVRTLLSESGRAIVAVNTHQRRWTARLWKRFQKVIEPHHPYHFTVNEYRRLFQRYFELDSTTDIEDEIIWVNKRTGPDLETPSLGDRVKAMLRFARPVNAFFGLLDLAGLPAHDLHGRGDSIYRHKAFVLKSKKVSQS